MGGSRFAKVAANFHTHPKVVAAGRNGREVFFWALCRNADDNRGGRVPAAFFAPAYLARMLDMTIAEAEDGLSRCESAGLLRPEEGSYEIVGWDPNEWGNPTSTERVRRFRQRGRGRSGHEDEEGERDETLHRVSSVSRNSETRETHTRGEERRVEEIVDPASGSFRTRPRRPPSGDHQTFVARFDELYAAKNLGAKPSWGKKQGRNVSELLKRPGGLAEALRRAENMFAAPPPWPPPPHDLATLVQHYDRFAQPHGRAGHYKHTGEEQYAGGEVEL